MCLEAFPELEQNSLCSQLLSCSLAWVWPIPTPSLPEWFVGTAWPRVGSWRQCTPKSHFLGGQGSSPAKMLATVHQLAWVLIPVCVLFTWRGRTKMPWTQFPGKQPSLQNQVDLRQMLHMSGTRISHQPVQQKMMHMEDQAPRHKPGYVSGGAEWCKGWWSWRQGKQVNQLKTSASCCSTGLKYSAKEIAPGELQEEKGVTV